METIWPVPEVCIMPIDEVDEPRPAALVFTQPAYQAVASRLRLSIVCQAEPRQATSTHWDALLEGFAGEVVYAVGGGLAVDAAKYMAAKRGLPLVCLPTALSVDAFFTWASGVRQEGGVRYLVTQPPEKVIIDWQVLAAAPLSIRAAGICDVLSIATGCWDWRFADERGQNPPEMPYLPFAAEVAQGILQGALDCAPAAGRGDPQGLKQLLDCLALEVQLTNQLGHARPEEGSEHYFAYAVENLAGHGRPHADLLAPGILLMARLQGQDLTPLRRALVDCRIPLDGIPTAMVEATLRALPDYCRQQGYPFGIAHTLDESALAPALAALA